MRKITKISIFLSIFAFIFACQSEKEITPQPDSAINQNLSKDLGGELAGVTVYAPYWNDASSGGYTGGYSGGDFSGSGSISYGGGDPYSGIDYNTVPDPIGQTRGLALRIPNAYKVVNMCVQFKDALKAKMQAQGIHGVVIKVQSVPGNRNIYSTLSGSVISTNGIHYGINVNGMVFDNMNPEGVNFDVWKKALLLPFSNDSFDITPTPF